MAYQNGMMFTTQDNDLDKYDQNCAQSFYAAWWYNKCMHVNPNGKYGGTTAKHMYWYKWKNAGKTIYMKESKIMVRC